MNRYITYKSPLEFRSKFNPMIGLHEGHLNAFNAEFLHPLLLRFCELTNIDANYLEYLAVEDLITEVEFGNATEMELVKPYIYDLLFDRIFKNEKGRVLNKMHFTFTYDVSLTPISKEEIRYGVINIGNKPFFYYIYIDLQKVIQFVKKLK